LFDGWDCRVAAFATRFYTVPNEAEARLSVAWSLFFIALLYLSAPALAVLVKFE
jgi:cation/acetate symporter